MSQDPFLASVELERAVVASIDPARDLVFHSVVGMGGNGAIIHATLTPEAQTRFPLGRSMRFAAKAVFNYGVNTSQIHNLYQNEYELLKTLPPHAHINAYLGNFLAELPDVVFERLTTVMKECLTDTRGGVAARRKVLFVVLRYHDMTLETFIKEHCPAETPMPVLLHLLSGLFSAYDHLEEHRMVHLDAKPNNVLVDISVAGKPCLILADFGTARITRADGKLPK